MNEPIKNALSQEAENKREVSKTMLFYRWNWNVTYPITTQCQEHSCKAEEVHTTLCIGISHLPVQGSLSAYKRKSVCNKQSEFIHLDMWHMSYNPGIWDGRQENCQLEDRLENPDSKWTKTWIEYSHATFTNENTDRFHFACRYTTSTTEGKRHMESDSH